MAAIKVSHNIFYRKSDVHAAKYAFETKTLAMQQQISCITSYRSDQSWPNLNLNGVCKFCPICYACKAKKCIANTQVPYMPLPKDIKPRPNYKRFVFYTSSLW